MRGIALTRRLDKADAAAELESIIREVVFEPGADHLQAAIEIGYALQEAGALGTLRRLAARLASVHPFEALAGSPEDGEFRALVFHECVLRGIDLSGTKRPLARPLALLPPRLLDCERHIEPATYGKTGSSHAMPFGPSNAVAPSYAPPAHALQPAHASTAPALAVPFTTWVEQSNATVDAYTFEFDAPQDVSAVHPENLRALGVASLADVQAVEQTSLDSVCAQLFAAAAYGGAYDNGIGGAYGRLAMWQSVAALADVPFTSVEDVSAHAADCTWWYYDGTPWFDAVAWDIGLIALRADRRSMAVLAATDTD